MFSRSLQRNAKPRKRHDFHHLKDALYAAKHEARPSNISGYCLSVAAETTSEIESLASRTSSDALQLRFAQNDMLDDR
jgi:hypothetical protein